MNDKHKFDASMLLHGEEIRYHVVRTNRKTISISVDKEAKIVIRTPLHMKAKQIQKLAIENQEQIFRVYNKALLKKNKKPIILMKEVKSIPFYGKERLVYIQSTDTREHIVDDGVCIEIFIKSNEVGAFERAGVLLENWYRKRGKDVFHKSAEMYAKLMNTSYQKITIKDQKTRWGSCSNHKNLNFNWRLLMMPKEVLDYVVVHELAHTLEMNHSKNFWLHVEEIIPDYKKYRKFLKEETSIYRIE